MNRIRRFFNKEKNYAIAKISGDGNNNVYQNVVFNTDFFRQEIQELVAKGDCEEAARKFKSLIDSIPAQHPLFPEWRYEVSVTNGNPVFNHVPNSPDAREKYPLHGTMRFTLGRKYRAFKNMDELLRYSYNKQTDIELHILEFKAWIGSLKIDEYNEADGATAVLSPPKFPPPTPMRLYFSNDDFSIDYIEMGLVEIDEPYIVLSNRKQLNSEIKFELKINIENTSDCKFSFKINEQFKHMTKANRIFNEFVMKVEANKTLNLKLLKEDSNLFSASGYNMDNPIPPSIDDFVSILKKLEEIEKFYKVEFYIEDEGILTDDLDKIEILYKAMKNEPRKGNYTDISINIVVNENLAENIKDIGTKKDKSLTIVTEGKQIALLGQTIAFDEYTVEFFNPTFKDKEGTLRKIEHADIGDVIKVEFTPSQRSSKKKALCLERYVYKKKKED